MRGKEIPLRARVYVSVGHDEYWSGEQRRHVEDARDAGSSEETPSQWLQGKRTVPVTKNFTTLKRSQYLHQHDISWYC